MSKERVSPEVGLSTFISGIKEEILSSQAENEGDRALFRMETITVKASVVASERSGGGIDVKLFSAKKGRSQEKAHEVVLTMSFLEGEDDGSFDFRGPKTGSDVYVQVRPYGEVMTSPSEFIGGDDPAGSGKGST